MKKKVVLIAISVVVLSLMILFGIEESRNYIVNFFVESYQFLRDHTIMILSAFFLVKGKFVLKLFLKKIIMLSATGLSKRYLIEKVITHHIKIHFFNDIAEDLQRLIEYIKKNFKNFPVVKQIIAGLLFLTSAGFVTKFMGSVIAMKVFVAKVWSFLLALFLKVSTAIVYFFTDYLWGMWIAPIVELIIFTWIIQWFEKVPFLKRGIDRVYQYFKIFFKIVEYFLETMLHIPLKRFSKQVARKIQKMIHRFIGYKRISAWESLKEVRGLKPSKQVQLGMQRALKENKRVQLLKKREHRKR